MWVTFSGWAAAAVLLVILGSGLLVQRHVRRFDTAAAERAAWITEVCDLHIGTLAANMPPQVISSDRHTVKPWFQGKIPFSFNLPENLPPDVKLDGANLTYLHNRPVAQLLYSLGRHRVSIFVQENPGLVETWVTRLQAEHAGFQITGFDTDDLEVIAVSDADPARLSGLVKIVEQAQANTRR
jgi:anti-sigma factor RsiW